MRVQYRLFWTHTSRCTLKPNRLSEAARQSASIVCKPSCQPRGGSAAWLRRQVMVWWLHGKESGPNHLQVLGGDELHFREVDPAPLDGVLAGQLYELGPRLVVRLLEVVCGQVLPQLIVADPGLRAGQALEACTPSCSRLAVTGQADRLQATSRGQGAPPPSPAVRSPLGRPAPQAPALAACRPPPWRSAAGRRSPRPPDHPCSAGAQALAGAAGGRRPRSTAAAALGSRSAWRSCCTGLAAPDWPCLLPHSLHSWPDAFNALPGGAAVRASRSGLMQGLACSAEQLWSELLERPRRSGQQPSASPQPLRSAEQVRHRRRARSSGALGAPPRQVHA